MNKLYVNEYNIPHVVKLCFGVVLKLCIGVYSKLFTVNFPLYSGDIQVNCHGGELVYR